uniref:Uncharacterized protein n=1 Tax=Anguilla anguilla TaxID=7936 RepID=A0A0E9XEJ9_ANGAN
MGSRKLQDSNSVPPQVPLCHFTGNIVQHPCHPFSPLSIPYWVCCNNI